MEPRGVRISADHICVAPVLIASFLCIWPRLLVLIASPPINGHVFEPRVDAPCRCLW